MKVQTNEKETTYQPTLLKVRQMCNQILGLQVVTDIMDIYTSICICVCVYTSICKYRYIYKNDSSAIRTTFNL